MPPPFEQVERGLKKWTADYTNLAEEVKDYHKKSEQRTLAQDIDFIEEEIDRIGHWLEWLNEAAILIDHYAPQTQQESESKRKIIVELATAGISMVNTRSRFRTTESLLRLKAARGR